MRSRMMVSAAGVAGVVGIVMGSTLPLAGQSTARPAPAAQKAPAGAAAPAKKYVAPRTENGQPDLNGVWAYGTATPLERPGALGTKAEFTADDEEAFAAAAKQAASRNFDVAVAAPPPTSHALTTISGGIRARRSRASRRRW